MPALVHCSYHKCLTVYFKQVMMRCLRRSGGYRHFNGDVEAFYAERERYRLASVNNHALALDRLGDYRVTRFVRDPRDLIVSGYLYHRRGAEEWCRVVDFDLTIGGNARPRALRAGESLMDCLQRLDRDEGLIAEIELRAPHLASMREWPDDDPRIRVWRYEDILGDEPRAFAEITAHYGLPSPLRFYAQRLARRFAAANLTGSSGPRGHVRDPRSGQWREFFTPAVNEAFNELCGSLPASLGYERPAGPMPAAG